MTTKVKHKNHFAKKEKPDSIILSGFSIKFLSIKGKKRSKISYLSMYKNAKKLREIHISIGNNSTKPVKISLSVTSTIAVGMGI